MGLGVRAPSLADDERFRAWWARYPRMSASPGAAYALTQMNGPIDTRHVLSAVSAPTLVIHRSGDRALPVEGARYLAVRIEGAKLAELPGECIDLLDRGPSFLGRLHRPSMPEQA